MKIHVGFIKEGTILHFPNSVYDYMKVCDRNEIGGRESRLFYSFLDDIRLNNFILDKWKNFCYNLITIKERN